MDENRYFVLHNGGIDTGWTMLVSMPGGRSTVTLEVARKKAEAYVRQNPDKSAMIVEAAYIVQTEFPPVRIRRFK